MCHRKRVEETKVPEMALDYLDNTLSRPEKAHDSYYRALQKSNQSAKKKNKPKKSTKIKQKTSCTILRANFLLSLNKMMTI